MRKLIFVITFILFHTVMAMAQSNDVSKAEVYGGYSYLNRELGPSLNGFNASVTGNLNKNFGVVAEVGGLYKNNSSLYTYMFGPKYSLRTKSNLTPYLHALFGTTSPQPVFAMALGGGLDYRVNDRVSLRLVQVDYLQFRNGNNHLNSARVSFGVVFHLGKK